MANRRVLVTCKLAWDALPEHMSRFGRLGVEVAVPDVPGQMLDESQMLGLVGDVEGILAGDDEITGRVMEAAPRLRVISKWGVGVDAIDLQAAARRGIAVYNTPGVFADELGDYALGFLLLLARRQHEVDREVRRGTWHKVRGTTLRDKTLGIVGLGSSGRALAHRARSLGMVVIGSDPVAPDSEWLEAEGVALVPLEEVLARSDVVSLHMPATESTRMLINRDSLASMKPGAWLINTSRGSLVDEAALVEALASGAVGAAALDVFADEPLPPGHPLTKLPDVILGSHNGSNTAEAVARTTGLAIENLLTGLEERPG